MLDDECITCCEMTGREPDPQDLCAKAQRPCGHHCNCIWIHDCCHWCGIVVSDDGESLISGPVT